jgi:hypothetical protein
VPDPGWVWSDLNGLAPFIASKARADSIGNKTPVAMDDLVEVGVFAEQPGNPGGLGAALYLK